jgi:hypothetical protein
LLVSCILGFTKAFATEPLSNKLLVEFQRAHKIAARYDELSRENYPRIISIDPTLLQETAKHINSQNGLRRQLDHFVLQYCVENVDTRSLNNQDRYRSRERSLLFESQFLELTMNFMRSAPPQLKKKFDLKLQRQFYLPVAWSKDCIISNSIVRAISESDQSVTIVIDHRFGATGETSCSRIWNWFFGSDLPIDEVKRAYQLSEFQNLFGFALPLQFNEDHFPYKIPYNSLENSPLLKQVYNQKDKGICEQALLSVNSNAIAHGRNAEAPNAAPLEAREQDSGI